MRIVEARVPLKLTLFGEHAVVYGRRALAATISERVIVRVKEGRGLKVVSPAVTLRGVSLDLETMRAENPQIKDIFSYVIKVIESLGKEDVVLEIDSSVDPSVGLGTSAAVVVGTLSAYSYWKGQKLTREEIARKSYEVELKVQSRGSPMDTATESLGGIVLVEKGIPRRLDLDSFPRLEAAYVERKITTKEILRKVSNMRELNPGIVDKLFDLIDDLVQSSIDYMKSGDLEGLGGLMYVNHGLLNALGVTDQRLDSIVSMARDMGVKGCKMSGAGGGGTVACLSDTMVPWLFRIYGAREVNASITQTGVEIYEGDRRVL